MPSIRFPRAIGNLLLFLLSAPHSRPPRSSLAVSLGLMHITPRALTFAICSHARMRPPLGSYRRRTTLAGPTTLHGDGDTPSCQRRRIIGAVHLAQCSGKKKGCTRPRVNASEILSILPRKLERSICPRKTLIQSDSYSFNVNGIARGSRIPFGKFHRYFIQRVTIQVGQAFKFLVCRLFLKKD